MTTDTPTDTAAALRAWSLLLRAHASTTRILSAALEKEHGLTINDFEVLHLLAQAEGRRLKRVEVARHVMLSPSGVTRLLEGLERAGLVERVACPSDLRVAYAQLTDAGADRLAAASCGHVAAIAELLAGSLAPEEVETLSTLLAKLPGVAATPGCCPTAGA